MLLVSTSNPLFTREIMADNGDISMPKAGIPKSLASTSVVPLPQNGSNKRSFSLKSKKLQIARTNCAGNLPTYRCHPCAPESALQLFAFSFGCSNKYCSVLILSAF